MAVLDCRHSIAVVNITGGPLAQEELKPAGVNLLTVLSWLARCSRLHVTLEEVLPPHGSNGLGRGIRVDIGFVRVSRVGYRLADDKRCSVKAH
jgi:hypothetical protein